MTILDTLAKTGVAFVALKENIRVEGKPNIQTKVMTTLFALDGKEDEIRRFLELGVSKTSPRRPAPRSPASPGPPSTAS